MAGTSVEIYDEYNKTETKKKNLHCIWNMLEEVVFSKVNPLVHCQVLLKTMQLKGHSHRAFLQLLSCLIRQLSAGFEICSIFLAFFCFFIKIEHVQYFLPKGQHKAGLFEYLNAPYWLTY